MRNFPSVTRRGLLAGSAATVAAATLPAIGPAPQARAAASPAQPW
ncbi:twin-arginine translocation signal domain-containing protein [Streptomyces sp. NPDC001595]